VVILNSDERNGRRVRQMVIEKLRGAKIERWNYMFSLLNGRLRIFNPVWSSLPSTFDAHCPVNDPSPATVSSGNENIDQVFGGFPKGSVSLLEIGPDVPQETIKRIELSLVTDFISKMRGVVWFPLYSMDYATFNEHIGQLVNPDTVGKCLRILHHDTYSDMGYPFVNMVEGTDASHDLKWNSLKYLLSGTTSPYLSLLGYDALEAIYGAEVMNSTAGHLDTMRRLGNVIVAEVTSASSSLKSLSHQANVHIKVESLAGTTMVCGEKPHTNYYHLEFQEGRLKPNLIPMV